MSRPRPEAARDDIEIMYPPGPQARPRRPHHDEALRLAVELRHGEARGFAETALNRGKGDANELDRGRWAVHDQEEVERGAHAGNADAHAVRHGGTNMERSA